MGVLSNSFKVKAKIKGFTLVETLVAMVILTISFGIGLMIYINVTKSNNLRNKIKANLILDNYFIETNIEKKYFDEIVEIEGFTINKSVALYHNQANLYCLRITVSDQNDRTLAQEKDLIRIQP